MFQSQKKPPKPFSRDQLYTSVYEAVRHRKTAPEDARHLTDTIIKQLRATKHSAIIQRHLVVTVSLGALERFDRTAALQYRAYHPL